MSPTSYQAAPPRDRVKQLRPGFYAWAWGKSTPVGKLLILLGGQWGAQDKHHFVVVDLELLFGPLEVNAGQVPADIGFQRFWG